jgi:membrane protease YdiL (CAAX protease family)
MDFWARRPLSVNLAGILLLAVATVALAWLGGQLVILVSAIEPLIRTSWMTPAFYMGLAAATLLVARFYDSMPASWTGLGFHRWTLRELGLGIAIGMGMVVLAWGPIALMGSVRGGEGWSGADMLYILIPAAIRAAGEEVLFRGYLFQRGVEIVGPVAATLVASGLFAVAHIGNPNVTYLGIVIIFLGGIFFSLGYLRTGSLWLPIGAHIAWNILLAKVLGVPVSGAEFGDSILRTTVSGPELLTGGAFGPEGGLLGAAALAAGIWALLVLPAVSYSPYVYAASFRAFHRKRRGAGAVGPAG